MNDDDVRILDRRAIIVFLVYFIVGFISVTLFVWAFVDRKTEGLDRKTTLQEDLTVVELLGDPDNWWIYPELQKGEIYKPPLFNWSNFWQKFKTKSVWDLEYNKGSGWISCKQNLTVIRNYTSDNNCKITLDFTAPYTADYRLTVAVDYALKKYFHKVDSYSYNLSFEKWNETFNITFDFSDIAGIPGVIITHGVKNVDGKDYFWFRARKNNVNEGKHIVLDPSYTVYTGSSVYAYYNNARRLIRLSNGTLYCTFQEASDVHIAYSTDNGENWNDYEVYGTLTSISPTIAVDSNDRIHMVWSGDSNLDDDNHIRYVNNSDWNNIRNISYVDTQLYWYPAIAVDGNDNLHVVYERDDDVASEVHYLNSTDGGDSWSGVTNLTNKASATDDAWYPCIAVNSTNSLHVVFGCEDYSTQDDILHMQSDDGGITWTDWKADPVLQTLQNERNPCFVIDDNDNLIVVGEDDDYDTFYRYNASDEPHWSDGNNSEEIYGDSLHTTVSVTNNDTIHIISELQSLNDVIHLRNYTEDNNWDFSEIQLVGTYAYPNLICSQYPVIGGVRTNRPDVGYAFIVVGTLSNVTYFASSDLSWETADAQSWQMIDYQINGSCYNTTTWKIIDSNINGSAYNITNWQMIDSSINGTCYNETDWRLIDYSINGSAYNITTWNMIDSSINGTAYNTSTGQSWNMIDSNINGTCYNITTWTMIDSSINGTCWNDTETWNLIDYNINGTCYNETLVFITITNPYPSDESNNAPIQPNIYATFNHTDGQTMNVTWYYGTSEGDENILIGTDINFVNSTQIELFFQATGRATTYYWRACANDGTNYENETFSFRTEGYSSGGGNMPNYQVPMSIASSALLIGLLALLMRRKRKRRNDRI